MTTKKFLVKQVLMSSLTAGIFAFGFSSCSDDDFEPFLFPVLRHQTVPESLVIRGLLLFRL